MIFPTWLAGHLLAIAATWQDMMPQLSASWADNDLRSVTGFAQSTTISSSSPLMATASKAERLADRVLERHPLIDLHVDLPFAMRYIYGNNVSHVDYHGPLPGNVDLNRLQQGKSGGYFSIAYQNCPVSPPGDTEEGEANALFLQPSDVVRDTLEQIDVTYQLVAQYDNELALAFTPREVLHNHRRGKISHLIGAEGAHLIGNSLAVLRMYHELGVRYLTLTHICHNAFADSSGSTTNETALPLHGGVSKLGKRLLKEMNRIGMIIDVSHTSDDVARQAIELSEAPIIFSHSGARSVFNHIRNVPDDILQMVAEGTGKDAVIGIPALPDFIGVKPTVKDIADHVEHIASKAGKSRVAIGSDFDGFIGDPVEGMADVRSYRNLLIELTNRGWSERDLIGLVSGNFLRIFAAVQRHAAREARRGTKADTVPWSARPDLRGIPM